MTGYIDTDFIYNPGQNCLNVKQPITVCEG